MSDDDTFSEDFIAQLCRDFQISPNLSGELHENLNDSARRWRGEPLAVEPWNLEDEFYKDLNDSAPRWREESLTAEPRNPAEEAQEDLDDSPQRWHEESLTGRPWNTNYTKKFCEISKHLEAAEKALLLLGQAALKELEDVQYHLADPKEYPRIEGTALSDSETIFQIIQAPPEFSDANSTISPSEVAKQLSAVRSVVALGCLEPTKKRGPKRDKRIENWMLRTRDAWCAATKQKFTRDFTETNEPTSEAAAFCVKLYSVLSPKTPNSRIDSAMKEVIRTRDRDLIHGCQPG